MPPLLRAGTSLQDFSTCVSSLHFAIVMYILYHYGAEIPIEEIRIPNGHSQWAFGMILLPYLGCGRNRFLNLCARV